MIVGDIMGVAAWIEEICDAVDADEVVRGWCRESHGRIRAMGGGDDEVKSAISSYLNSLK